jgi:hypothetical protein
MSVDPKKTDYLGDGLYVKVERGQLELRANDLDRPSDTVYLDPSVYKALIRFADQLGWNRPPCSECAKHKLETP